MERHWPYRLSAALLRRGGVIGYPTEAVFGLGCDPQNPIAVERILALKQRPWHKGLIIIAADREQLTPYVDLRDPQLQARLNEQRSAPTTWLLPRARSAPGWISGRHDTVAVRITTHLPVVRLCREFAGAIVSTSANPADLPPAKSRRQVRRYFGTQLDYLLNAPLGDVERPSEIRCAHNGEVLRSG